MKNKQDSLFIIRQMRVKLLPLVKKWTLFYVYIPNKIINRVDNNWAQFDKIKYFKNQGLSENDAQPKIQILNWL